MGQVAQCCAGPRDSDKEKRASFPDEPFNFATPKKDVLNGADIPAGAPVFAGQVPAAAPAVPDLAAPPREPPAVQTQASAPAPAPQALGAAPKPAPAPAPQALGAAPKPAAPAPEAEVPKEEPAVVVKEEPPAVPKEEPAAVSKEEPAAVPAATEEDPKTNDKRHDLFAPLDDDECAPSLSVGDAAKPDNSVKATKSSEPEEELPPAGPGGKVWVVVGGDADKGGIVVRKGEGLKSAALERLATGARVQELKKVGERLHFKKLSGSGPAEGWASTHIKGKDLLVLE